MTESFEKNLFSSSAREPLLLETERFKTILDTAYDAFVGMNSSGYITDWNKQATVTFGWEKKEVIGKTLSEILIPERYREAHELGLQRFLATGEGPALGHRMELPALHKNGTEVPVELTIRAIKQENDFLFSAFLRDISERKKAQLFQNLQLEVTRALVESRSVAQAFVKCMTTVCKALDWDWGAFWRLDPKTQRLLLTNSYHHEDSQLEEFERICRNIAFAPNHGLVGKVWASGQPCWSENVQVEANFLRGPFSIKAGLHGAVFFPVSIGNEFIGVLEFLSKRPHVPDKKLFEVMTDIGSRLGLFIQKQESTDVLLQTEKRFETLISGIKDYAIFMLDPEGKVNSWNEGARSIQGYEASEILGKHFSVFYPKEAIEQKYPQYELQKAIELGRFEDEGWRIRKDGSRFWANVVITAIYDEYKRVIGFAKVSRDMTEKRKAQDRLNRINEELEAMVAERTSKLHQSEKQLRLITDTLPVAVLYIDPNYKYRFVNNTYSSWLGTTKDQIVGKSIAEVVPSESLADAKESLARIFNGEIVTHERTVQYPDGVRLLSSINFPDFNEQGKVIGCISVVSDVTAQRKGENELRQAKAAAESANQAKSAFLANMSHEIRTPLGAVLGFSELLTEPGTTQKDKDHYLEVMKRNGDLLSNIIGDILDLSKVEVGKLEMESQETSVAEILTDLSTLLSLRAKEKGIQFSIASKEDVPKKIRTDSLRLRQILLNIVGNAIKFTDQGSVNLTLQMQKTARGESKLAFIVEDTGPGIAADQVDKLFKPFSQADISTRRKFGGTGLGLILSKRLANLLGGDVILVKSEVNKGSLFSVTIDPISVFEKKWDYKDEIKKSPLKINSPGTQRLKNRKILLVEDSPDNQVLIQKFLAREGAVVEIAENGKVAVEKATQSRFDAILMDLQMPMMDGHEATSILRKQGLETPIIALTAHALNEERQQCLETGFDEHLTKPIDRAALIETLSLYFQDAN